MIRITVPIDPSAALTYGADGLVRIERGLPWVEITTAVIGSNSSVSYNDDLSVPGSVYRSRYSILSPMVPGDFSDYSPVGSAVPPTAWCSLGDVKSRLAGDGTRVPTDWDAPLDAIINGVSQRLSNEIAHVRGMDGAYNVFAASTASVRRYTGKIADLLLIADCVEIDSVTDNGVALVLGTDYDVFPLNGPPYTGIVRLNGSWNLKYGAISVSAKWGLFVTLPYDLWDDAVSESVAVYLSARAGNTDTVDMDAFGKIILRKALLSKTFRDIHLYAYGAGFLR